MTAEDLVGATHPASPLLHPEGTSWEGRRRSLEREEELCRQRIARLRAQGASEVSLLHWLERLQACEAELALLEQGEARPSRRTRPEGEGR
ncbi:MAG: hypothetical protein H5T59_08175 [Anaerolineae bacterium]|nr:hypothetical protein [Anaerolineae bacterium]